MTHFETATKKVIAAGQTLWNAAADVVIAQKALKAAMVVKKDAKAALVTAELAEGVAKLRSQEGQAEINKRKAEEVAILECLSNKPTHIENIVKETELTLEQVSTRLMALEIQRYVIQQPGKFFMKV